MLLSSRIITFFLKASVLCACIFVHCACGKDDVDPPVTEDPMTVQVDPFDRIPPLEEMVMYEVNLRAFSTQGNLKGVESRLDDIEKLGVNVIWLMPVYPIGMKMTVNSPYCIRNYTAVNPEFGTTNDLIHFVNAAHARNIAVILDWVGNHTAWDHPWINAHSDWYAKDANGNIIAPSGTGWTDVAELNFTNGAMRQEMIKSMKYWLDNTGIDGFRCDAADFVPYDFWQEAIGTLKANSDKDLIFLAEGGVTDNFTAGFEMDYAWDFNTTLKEVFKTGAPATEIIETHLAEYQKIPSGARKLRYTTNHDLYAWEASPVSEFGLEGSFSAFVLAAFLPGVPLIYSGQEVATTGQIPFFEKKPIDWSAHPEIRESYEKFMQARRSLPAVHYGDLTDYSTADVVAFTRSYQGSTVVVIVNVRKQTVDYTIPEELKGDWSDPLSGATINLAGTGGISPGALMVLKR